MEQLAQVLAVATLWYHDRGGGMMIDREVLAIWTEYARRDDWHRLFVGSDIRQMLAAIERLCAENERLLASVELAITEAKAEWRK